MENTHISPREGDLLRHEEELAELLWTALEQATDGCLTNKQRRVPLPAGGHADLELTLELHHDTINLLVEIKRVVYPRDIRDAVWRLEEQVLAKYKKNAIILIAADSFSKGAKELMRERGIGYFERTGSLYLKWSKGLIYIDKPSRPSKKNRELSLFTDAREMAVHGLLRRKFDWLTGLELAEITGTSTYTCSKVLEELERREWCVSEGAGRQVKRRLVKPALLLDEWAEAWKTRKESRSRWYLWVSNSTDLFHVLGELLQDSPAADQWAFTGTAAANRYAPLLTAADTAEVIIPKGMAELLGKKLNLTKAEKGSNVTFIEREGASLLFTERSDSSPVRLASPYILYLDLLNNRGRNKELAENVRQKLDI